VRVSPYHSTAVALSGEIAALESHLRESGAGMVTIATAESATAGGIARYLTEIAGASDYVLGGVVAYSNLAKHRLLGVTLSTLERFGAVSVEVAEQMAQGGRRTLGAAVCVADTGIAGPGGATLQKPVGLFYIALATPEGCSAQRFDFPGSRECNREAAAEASLTLLRDYLVQCCVARGVDTHDCL
jgi:PncC family amidohydrolase